jgi:hypothetical protein
VLVRVRARPSFGRVDRHHDPGRRRVPGPGANLVRHTVVGEGRADADTYFGKVVQHLAKGTPLARAQALTTYFAFLELRHKLRSTS